MIRQRTDVLRAGVYKKKKKRRRAKKIEPPTAAAVIGAPARLFVPESARISRLAEFMAEAAMLRHDILPYRTSIDIGTDIITHHWSVLRRVQIKGQATNSRLPDTFTFSTCRNELTGKRPYRHDEIDAFIFVHTELARFFVVPAPDIIASGRRTITFSPTSHQQWENAWWILKTV